MLDDISHAKPPSRYLEQQADEKKVALQLGTLGGGNHFLGMTSQLSLCVESAQR